MILIRLWLKSRTCLHEMNLLIFRVALSSAIVRNDLLANIWQPLELTMEWQSKLFGHFNWVLNYSSARKMASWSNRLAIILLVTGLGIVADIYQTSSFSWPGCSSGIGDRRILRLLHRILRLNFACFLTGLCPSIITLLLLFSNLLFLQFVMKPLHDPI